MKVSYKIPAYLSNFSTLDNGRTIAKLKVFYIGETADGRIFDKDFAEKLAETLPYCPVVAFYSDIKDDFVGHNSTQYVYGLVQPTAEYGYEKDDEGKEWLVTEVMLYTDRGDNIGKVADKIVGHPHSLEMNPKTAKYSVFRENGKTKIKFTEGSLVGLSVLGMNQKPAFTGSEFFMATSFSDMRAKFETFFSCLEENSRGEQMEKEQFETLANFARLSYTEKMSMAEKTIRTQLGDYYSAYIVDMDDTTCTAYVIDYEVYVSDYRRYDYVLTDAEFTISNEQKVYAKYITKAEMDYLEGFGKSQEIENTTAEITEEVVAEEMKNEVDEATVTETTEEVVEAQEVEETTEELVAQDNSDEDEKDDKDDKDDDQDPEDPEDDSDDKDKDDKFTNNSEIEEEDDEQHSEELPEEDGTEEEETNHSLHNPAALSDSERIELENYRRKEKVELINSFAEMIDASVLNEFVSKVDEYDYAKLEAELSIIHSKASRTNRAATTPSVRPMSFGSFNRKNGEMSYKELVAKQLKK